MYQPERQRMCFPAKTVKWLAMDSSFRNPQVDASTIEASFIQAMGFSVVLLTLGLGFKHAARKRAPEYPAMLVDGLSAYVSLVAFLFGGCALYIYSFRGNGASQPPAAELRARLLFSVLGGLLLLAEGVVAVAMFLHSPRRGGPYDATQGSH